MQKVFFRLTCFAQKFLCWSSLITARNNSTCLFYANVRLFEVSVERTLIIFQGYIALWASPTSLWMKVSKGKTTDLCWYFSSHRWIKWMMCLVSRILISGRWAGAVFSIHSVMFTCPGIFENGDVFPPFSTKYASTLSVFETFPPVHTKTLKQWKCHSRICTVWRMTSESFRFDEEDDIKF